MSETFDMAMDGVYAPIACAICGSAMRRAMDDVQFSLDKARNITTAKYAICGGCGVVQKYPLPTSAELKKYYSESWQDSLARPREFFDETAEWIACNAEPPAGPIKAIDIGSKGRHMANAIERVGWTADWNTSDQLWVGDGLPESRAYDFVCASHVLEHTHDPVVFIQDVLGMLSADGFAYIEVPSLEAHADDSGTCDDINQNHLWHFNIDSLCRLVRIAGGSVLATATCRTRRNPANRMLIARRSSVETRSFLQLSRLTNCIELEYWEAHEKLSKLNPTAVCLYAASNSYLRLLSLYPDTVRKFEVFDLYFQGEILGNRVYHPAEIKDRGYTTAAITTRVWAPAHEIKHWIRTNIPGVEPIALFPMVEEFQPADVNQLPEGAPR